MDQKVIDCTAMNTTSLGIWTRQKGISMTGDRMPTDDQDRLATFLRQEAQATRPLFSEPLHERICRAVTEDQIVLMPCRAATPWRQRLAPYAVAAAAVLGISLTTWWLSRPFGHGPDLTETVTAEPAPEVLTRITGQVAEQLGLLVDATLSRQQWGYLDHDVQLATRLLMEQLPLAPEPDEGTPSKPTPPLSKETAG